MKYGIAIFTIALAVGLSAQEKKVPKDSTRVSIPGCSKGSAFVVTASPEEERITTQIAIGRRFRLTGSKDVLNEIKKREGNMIEVTGIVKNSDLKGPGGITVGGVRITGGPPQAAVGGVGRTAPETVNAILDVEGWRPLAESCPT